MHLLNLVPIDSKTVTFEFQSCTHNSGLAILGDYLVRVAPKDTIERSLLCEIYQVCHASTQSSNIAAAAAAAAADDDDDDDDSGETAEVAQ